LKSFGITNLYFPQRVLEKIWGGMNEKDCI
jgi:hypothetical protein